MEAIKLKQANLSQLNKIVPSPQYDRSKVTPGIVHVGIGNFHRSHQAFIINEYMQQCDDYNWGIVQGCLL